MNVDFFLPWFTRLRHAASAGLLIALVALLAGSASALFLAALDWATTVRVAHPWLLAGLPLAGFAVGWVYWRVGQPVEAGNNLLIDEIHDPKNTIPLRMAPLILAATVISHLFGASVGREGTAVQMGGALADQLNRLWPQDAAGRQRVLMTGISAGFASVFGTPLAGRCCLRWKCWPSAACGWMRCCPAYWRRCWPIKSAWPGALSMLTAHWARCQR